MTELSNMLAARPSHREWDSGADVAGYAWDAHCPKAVLLLQHGFGEYAQRFVTGHAALIPHLLRIGISVRAIDFRGHGNSPGRRGMIDVRLAVQDHLKARRTLAQENLPIFLFGHSLGGLVTAASVCADPLRVGGVVLSSPALRGRDSATLRWLTRTIAHFAPSVPAQPSGNPEGLTRVRAVVDSNSKDPALYNGPLRMLVAATALAVSHETRQLYQRCKSPVFVFHGTADEYTDIRGSIDFIRGVSAVDKTLHVEPDGRHELLSDYCATEVREQVLDWLRSRLELNTRS